MKPVGWSFSCYSWILLLHGVIRREIRSQTGERMSPFFIILNGYLSEDLGRWLDTSVGWSVACGAMGQSFDSPLCLPEVKAALGKLHGPREPPE